MDNLKEIIMGLNIFSKKLKSSGLEIMQLIPNDLDNNYTTDCLSFELDCEYPYDAYLDKLILNMKLHNHSKIVFLRQPDQFPFLFGYICQQPNNIILNYRYVLSFGGPGRFDYCFYYLKFN